MTDLSAELGLGVSDMGKGPTGTELLDAQEMEHSRQAWKETLSGGQMDSFPYSAIRPMQILVQSVETCGIPGQRMALIQNGVFPPRY